MDVTYGIKVKSTNDPYVKIAEEAMHGLAIACVPGTFLVVSPALYPAHRNTPTYCQDAIPALKYVPSWFPGANFKRKARQWWEVTHELVEVPFAETKRNMVSQPFPLVKQLPCLIFFAGGWHGALFIHIAQPRPARGV